MKKIARRKMPAKTSDATPGNGDDKAKAAPAATAAVNSAIRQGGGTEPTLVLEATLYTLEQLQTVAVKVPQLALVGRSNVGKSSLLNALARRRNLAKTSSTPGKTRSVNLFIVQPDGFCLTDLPGYGYARRAKEEREAWGRLIETYLLKTSLISAVVLLLDCRLPPQESDKVMVDFALAHKIPLIPVLTKADKCSQRERAARQKEWAMFLRGTMPLPVSARTGLGLDALWERLRAAVIWPEAEAGQDGVEATPPEPESPASLIRVIQDHS